MRERTPKATAAVLRDCAARQQCAEAILSGAGIELYYLDSGCRLVDCNPAGERALGGSRDALAGRPLFARKSGWDDPVRRRRESMEVMASGEARLGSIESVQRGTRVATLRVDRLPLVDGSGRAAGLLVAATAVPVFEEAAAEEAERFRLLADHLPGIVYLCRNDERWSMLYISGKVGEITGYPRSAFLEDRVSFVDLYHPDDASAIGPAVERALAERRDFELDYRIRHADGQWRWIRERGSGVYRRGRLAYLQGYLSDVTSQRASEAERERLIAELGRKNDELERFTYTVSHELKSPVVTMQGFARLLGQDLDAGDREAARRELGSIERAASVMQRLVDDLLALSQRGLAIGERTEVAFGRVVERALERLAGSIRECGCAVDVSPDLPPVFGSEDQLVDVVQNLVENALRYRREGAPPRVEIGAEVGGGEATLWVRDDGVGIPPEQLVRVFGLFVRLEADRGGSGIGLALARRIVETHGGRIWAESDGPGRGTRFLFTLPQPPGPPADTT